MERDARFGNVVEVRGEKFQWPEIWQRLWLPFVAWLSLIAACLSVPPYDLDPLHDSQAELIAHQLGHKINSTWVGIGLLFLVVPSIIKALRRESDPTRWWAADAIICDYLVIDCFFRRFMRFPRPGDTDHAGFPSGHTTFAFLMAWLVYQKYPKLGPLWFAIAVAVGWSRVEVHAHFNYQVITGALFGTLLGWFITNRQHGVIFPRLCVPDKHIVSKEVSV